MTKRRTARGPGSPVLNISIGQRQYEQAIRSNSGGCLIADAIKEQYPHLAVISVDMATVRVRDGEKGLKYTYLTPALAQHLLIAFDQGWRQPVESLTIKTAVKIDHITRSPSDKRSKAQYREERIAELENKLDLGEELTPPEKAALSRMTNPNRKPPKPRPSSAGPITDVITSGNRPATIVGGKPIPQQAAKDNPNLLRGRNRHFGAKLAHPGIAFDEAVEQRVRQELAKFDAPSQGKLVE